MVKIDTIDACIEDLGAVARHLKKVHERGVAPKPWLELDLSMPQMKALMVTLHHGAVSAKTIADELGIGPSAVTPLVDKLVAQQLVSRTHDEGDRRVIWIKPTQKAAKLSERLMSASRAFLRALIEAVPSDELPKVHAGLAALAATATRLQADHQAKDHAP
jgi:DNA-binding MarR family transcriptional regulator